MLQIYPIFHLEKWAWPRVGLEGAESRKTNVIGANERGEESEWKGVAPKNISDYENGRGQIEMGVVKLKRA